MLHFFVIILIAALTLITDVVTVLTALTITAQIIVTVSMGILLATVELIK
jgi:hypothetical protein